MSRSVARSMAGLLIAGILAPAATAEATVPGANGLILFRSGSMLLTMRPDGTHKTRVAVGTNGGWSPDGTRIVYLREYPNDLWTMNADGSGKQQLTHLGVRFSKPSWSPDGSTIVFAATLNDPDPLGCFPCNYELYTIQPDGHGLTRLTHTGAPEDDPAWSPDGTRIVYARHSAGHGGIFVMAADGSHVHRLNGDPYAFAPAWSPDGGTIAFTGAVSASDPPQIFVMNADGSAVHSITPIDEFSQMPSFSPDGTLIAYIHTQDPAGVWVMGTRGENPHTLTAGAGDRFEPSWGPRPA